MSTTTMARPVGSLWRTIARRLKRDIPVERYVVRANHEWAIFYIDEKLGAFNCQSTYGTYAYIWRSIGERTLKDFLLDLNFDYFMGKTRPGYRCFDYDRTIENIKERILEARRDCPSITREIARDAWAYLDFIDHRENGTLFLDELTRSDAMMRVLGSEYYEYGRESADTDSRLFWKTIWPEFLKQIRGRK